MGSPDLHIGLEQKSLNLYNKRVQKYIAAVYDVLVIG